jgi:hypothetical protein
MITRTLKSLLIALTLVLVVPTGTALAKQVSDGSAFSGQPSQTQFAPTKAYKLPAVVVSEKTAGLQQPTQSEPGIVASSDGNFDWGAAGIGAGIVAAGILVGLGGAAAVRHRHHPLPH